MEDTGFAAPTAAVDGRLVYAMFASGDVAAFDLDGRLAWARSLGVPENAYGHAASLATHENLLFVQFDQGSAKDDKSKMLALDVATGKTVWEVARDVSNSWPSPAVVQVADGSKQLLTCSDPWVIAYNPADGTEIWRSESLEGDVGPSPVYADGVVYVANEFPGISAIRGDGSGDVTESHVLWEGEDDVPDTASPLATSQYLLVAASYGILACYSAKEGELLWEEEFDMATFTSSPSLAEGRVYLFDLEGKAWVVEPGPESCKRIAEANLAEECVTSPAFREGRLYIRGKEHLFCIGAE
jgi:outer membrane protein assembly factor BamB